MTTDTLPTALRKVMVDKFKEFDEYQLGKQRSGTLHWY